MLILARPATNVAQNALLFVPLRELLSNFASKAPIKSLTGNYGKEKTNPKILVTERSKQNVNKISPTHSTPVNHVNNANKLENRAKEVEDAEAEAIEWLDKLKSGYSLFNNNTTNPGAFLNLNMNMKDASFYKVDKTEKKNALLELIKRSDLYIPESVIEKNMDQLEFCRNMNDFNSLLK